MAANHDGVANFRVRDRMTDGDRTALRQFIARHSSRTVAAKALGVSTATLEELVGGFAHAPLLKRIRETLGEANEAIG